MKYFSKQLIVTVVVLCVFTTFGFAYSLSTSDQAFAKKFVGRVETMVVSKGATFRTMVINTLQEYQDSRNLTQRFTAIIDEIINQLQAKELKIIFDSVVAKKKEPVAKLQIKLISLYERATTVGMLGFGYRVETEDVYNNAKNPVLTMSVPDGYCIQLNSLPLDFLYVRSSGTTWQSIYTYDGPSYDMDGYASSPSGLEYCDVKEIKIVLPRNSNMFAGFSLGFILENTKYTQLPACTRAVVSADNANYEELKFCFLKYHIGFGYSTNGMSLSNEGKRYGTDFIRRVTEEGVIKLN